MAYFCTCELALPAPVRSTDFRVNFKVDYGPGVARAFGNRSGSEYARGGDFEIVTNVKECDDACSRISRSATATWDCEWFYRPGRPADNTAQILATGFTTKVDCVLAII